jgi:hypothetical protein
MKYRLLGIRTLLEKLQKTRLKRVFRLLQNSFLQRYRRRRFYSIQKGSKAIRMIFRETRMQFFFDLSKFCLIQEAYIEEKKRYIFPGNLNASFFYWICFKFK